MSKILTLAATGVVGLVLGAGIGAAAADQDGSPPASEQETVPWSMEDMHATMVEQMPAEVREQCDAMHASMGERMDGAMPAGHRTHHLGTGG